jgi:nitric oxide dioxygenase
MTPEQIILVQVSFNKIAPIRASVGALFYRRLFEIDPKLRWLFTGDMDHQSQKLIAMIELIVDNLSQFEILLPHIQALGRAHAGYGVLDEHYDTVLAGLLWTLQAGLEEQFDATDEAAWTAAYTMIAETMKAAAQSLSQLS